MPSPLAPIAAQACHNVILFLTNRRHESEMKVTAEAQLAQLHTTRWQDRDCLFEPILAMLNAGIGFHRAWLANHGTQLDWRNRMHYDYELVIQEARRLGHPIIITNGKLLTLVPGGDAVVVSGVAGVEM